MYFASFILKNLTRRPIRTALTVLGLAVAVGSMIALLGISDNVERAITEAFEKRGVDLVVIKGGVPNQLDSELDEPLADRVKEIDGVEGVDAYKSFNVYENGSVIILMNEAQRLSGRPGKITGFSVRVRKTADHPDADVEAVRQKILALTDDQGKPVRLSVQTTSEYVRTASHVQLTRAMVWMVSVIAIAIGVISLLNTMVMSVLERTHEIGILR